MKGRHADGLGKKDGHVYVDFVTRLACIELVVRKRDGGCKDCYVVLFTCLALSDSGS